jgi:uracil-DNA glycosylase family 4
VTNPSAGAKFASEWEALNREIVACRRCPRLVAWREQVAREKRRAFQDWDYWGKPLTGFGDRGARVLILGLAPAAHGGNRTGRMFTGDGSADTLIAVLHQAGFANQPTSEHRQDGLELRGAFMTAVARCAPPGNKPTPAELAACRPFLERELELLAGIRVVLALGRIAFDGYLQLLKQRGIGTAGLAFGHGATYPFAPPLPTLVASYHPSRQNTQTGRLTPQMMAEVMDRVRRLLEGELPAAGADGPSRLHG